MSVERWPPLERRSLAVLVRHSPVKPEKAERGRDEGEQEHGRKGMVFCRVHVAGDKRDEKEAEVKKKQLTKKTEKKEAEAEKS